MDLMRWEGPRGADLWDAFEGMQGQLDRALELFRVPEASGLFDRDRVPAADLSEDREGYLLVVDLPGVDRKDLEVSVAGDLLTVKGDKKADLEGGKPRIFRKETWVGSFARTLGLPADADASRIEAELKDGVLKVRIPKREETKPRLITVAAH